MMTEMSWQVNEEASRDMTGEADGMNLGVDSRDGVMHIWMSDLWLSMRRWLVGEKGLQHSVKKIYEVYRKAAKPFLK